MKPGTKGFKRILNASQYSYNGIIWACKKEAAFRQEIYIAIVLLPLLFIFNVTPVEKISRIQI